MDLASFKILTLSTISNRGTWHIFLFFSFFSFFFGKLPVKIGMGGATHYKVCVFRPKLTLRNLSFHEIFTFFNFFTFFSFFFFVVFIMNVVSNPSTVTK